VNGEVFAKRHPDPASAACAVANHRWLAGLGGPLRLPGLLATSDCVVHLEHAPGRHACPGDLLAVAGHLGDVHGWVHTQRLRRARLDTPHPVDGGHQLPDFLAGRLPALRRRLHEGVPGTLLTPDSAERLLRDATAGPAAIYKDTNPRNLLIGRDGLIHVDTDDLTLAPFGYDLAKLIVTLAMTHGPLPPGAVDQALAAYNAAAVRHRHGLGLVTPSALLSWAEVHHALTGSYLGRHGYRHSWPSVREVVPGSVGFEVGVLRAERLA